MPPPPAKPRPHPTVRRPLLQVVTLLAAGLLLDTAQAQAPFPSKPIRAISQFGSGASGDLVARIVLTPMAEILGQPIVIENRPGATGLVASEPVARAAPDGYTLLISSPSQLVRFAAGYKGSVDPVRDFTPIFPVETTPPASSSAPRCR